MARAAATPSLAAAIAANVRKHGPRCGVALLLDQLDDAQRADFHAASSNTGIPATAISKGLAAIGHDVPLITVQRHRRGDCTCPR